MPAHRPHVVVLGGGACGMSAALELVARGARVTVLEREERVGGLCGTVQRDGFRFDLGGHRFITGNRDIDRLVRELVGDDLLERQRSSVVLNGGRRYRYPLELEDVLRQYGLRRGVTALASYFKGRLGPGPSTPDRSFEDWVRARFGERLYGAFFGPYTAKLWGIDPKEISSDWAAQRISVPSLWDACLRLVGWPRPAARTYARRYRYPRYGIGQIFERCAAQVTRRGGEVLLGATVWGLSVRRGRVRAVRYRDARGEREVPCDGVVSSMSLPHLARMLQPPPPVERRARRLRFRAIRLLNVMLDGGPVSPHTWMYVSEPQYLMTRIQEPRHRSPQMAPEGCTSLMLEIPCEVDDATWRAPDADVYARCAEDLASLGFGDVRARTRGFFSSYVREGYPVYHLGYDADRRDVLGHVLSVDGLASCGRQGAFRYVFMDTAMEMGQLAAKVVLGHLPPARAAQLDPGASLHEAHALTA